MQPASTRNDAFTSHVLEGFEPHVPHIRYPVTLGLFQEGNNLGLFLAPASLGLLRDLVGVAPDDQALVLAGAAVLDDAFLEAPASPRLVSWEDIATLSGDNDIIHLPAETRVSLDQISIPTPILAAPEHAVPTDLGSRVAIGFNDGCHAAVISPHRPLISRCLTGFIQAFGTTAAQRPCPAITPTMIAPLLQPMAPGEWRELRLIQGRRFFALEFAEMGDPERTSRWICPNQDNHWRTGWSW